MDIPRLTDERLRYHLNTNQPMRERLCMALLSIAGGYTDITPRRPMGGPDGGRDIQALYHNDLIAYGAVGFRNSANDSRDDREWAKAKFAEDLESALNALSNLTVFIFFTNVDLPPSSVDNMKQLAISKGIQVVDIFYRERMRLLLDQPSGFAFRLQYLSIPLSEAEQVAFFSAYGDELLAVMNNINSRIDYLSNKVEPTIDLDKVQGFVDLIFTVAQGVTKATHFPLKSEHWNQLDVAMRHIQMASFELALICGVKLPGPPPPPNPEDDTYFSQLLQGSEPPALPW